MTCGLQDRSVPDTSLESAACKVAGTEFLWYAANRTMQLRGGGGYMRDEPYEKILRDIRIFPIFEGANDVLRAFVALSGMKPVGERLKEMGDVDLGHPIRTFGVLADYAAGRVKREVVPERVNKAHKDLEKHAKAVSEQVKRLAGISEKLLREHRGDIVMRQFAQKRVADSFADIYGQLSLLSRMTAMYESQGVELSGQESFIADTFCTRAARRVNGRFDRLDSNDDDRMSQIARLAYKRGGYGYALFD
jgi:acyl-CoA dehydrogenase family protein 9